MPVTSHTETNRKVGFTSGIVRIATVLSSILLLLTIAACSSDKISGGEAGDPVGSLLVSVSGLSGGTTAQIVLRSSQDGDIAVTPGTAIGSLKEGVYTVVAQTVVENGFTFEPQPAVQSVTIARDIQSSATVAYRKRSGAISVVVNGLPDGTNAAIALTSPNGETIQLTDDYSNAVALPGLWRLNASEVSANGFTWLPDKAFEQLELAAGAQRTFNINYSVASGALTVQLQGLPENAPASVSVTGPQGFQRTVTRTETFTDLTPGSYTASAGNITHNGTKYAPANSTVQVNVAASVTPSIATIEYEVMRGTLTVEIGGVPTVAEISVTGPEGFSRNIQSTTVFTNVLPGTYTVSAPDVSGADATWGAQTKVQQVEVAAEAEERVVVTYVITSGSLSIGVAGLPVGGSGQVTISGPNGFAATIGNTQTFRKLVPGEYTLIAANVDIDGKTYIPTPLTMKRNVVASTTAADAHFAYAAVPTTGALIVTIGGLPAGALASISVIGPDTTFSVTAGRTISGLRPGIYTLNANQVNHSGTLYYASPPTREISVVAGSGTTASFEYAAAAPTDDLRIAYAYVTQVTQRSDGSVPLVAGRPALLRVFGLGNRVLPASPSVRVRLFNGSTLIRTEVIAAPEATVRSTVAEATLSSSWNLPLEPLEVIPGLRILVDIDPLNHIAEGNEDNNIWPLNGEPKQVAVFNVPALNVRFVPVVNNGMTGSVSSETTDSYTTSLRRMFPLGTVSTTVRSAFTSAAPPLTSGGGGWNFVLSEMQQLRIAEGTGATYYGVVKVGYGSGNAGLGYVGYPAAIGWDHASSRDWVAAHEFGHTFNRWHSPCGVSSDLEPGYPYAGGLIGVLGWNVTTSLLVPTTASDIMGYCTANQWISDYTWEKVMQFRGVSSALTESAPRGALGGLMVSATDIKGKITVQPAFRVDARTPEPAPSPTHVVEALDSQGRVIASVMTQARSVDHIADEHHVATVIPWTQQLEQSLVSLRIRSIRNPLSAAVRTSSIAAAAATGANLELPAPAATVQETAPNMVKVELSGPYVAAMVRDAATGEVLSFVRSANSAPFAARSGRALSIVYSDGVRSVTRRVQR